VLNVDPDALRQGCERAHDLFMLGRLSGHDGAASTFEAVFGALGIDQSMRERLQRDLLEMLPVRGDALFEATATTSMVAGVLVGLLIADSALPADELDLPAAAP
jgi:hypothetical protein